MRCLPWGTNVQCTAEFYDTRQARWLDVTNDATWIASEPLGTFNRGLFVPTATGEVDLWVQYESFRYDLPWRFL
ncbi:MAG: hypothetical protein ACLGH0_05050, partial [Thermoanaerobaculia bacterium]